MSNLILPPLRRTADDAAEFAHHVHRDQIDKAGRPYVEHLSRVAGRVFTYSCGCPFWDRGDTDEAYQIAWLHDTIEDQNVPERHLIREGFSEHVVAGVSLLTKPNRPIPYTHRIWRLADLGNLQEILVKLADVEDNSDPSRLALLDERTRERLTKKYAGAADLLREAARKKGWQG